MAAGPAAAFRRTVTGEVGHSFKRGGHPYLRVDGDWVVEAECSQADQGHVQGFGAIVVSSRLDSAGLGESVAYVRDVNPLNVFFCLR